MPKLTVTVPHTLDQQEATTRLKGILEKIKERYQGQVSDLHEDWQGNTLNYGFKTFGFAVKGAMHVEPQQVRVEDGQRVEHGKNILGGNGGFAVMDINYDAAHALLAKRNQNTPADNWRHPVR